MMQLMESTSNILKWLSNVLERIAIKIDINATKIDILVANKKLSINDNEIPDMPQVYVPTEEERWEIEGKTRDNYLNEDCFFEEVTLQFLMHMCEKNDFDVNESAAALACDPLDVARFLSLQVSKYIPSVD